MESFSEQLVVNSTQSEQANCLLYTELVRTPTLVPSTITVVQILDRKI